MLGFFDFQKSVYPRWLELAIKCKVCPLKCHEHRREQNYSSTLTLILALDGVGGWLEPNVSRFTTGYGHDAVHILLQAEWAPGPIWMGAENFSTFLLPVLIFTLYISEF